MLSGVALLSPDWQSVADRTQLRQVGLADKPLDKQISKILRNDVKKTIQKG